MSRKIIKAVKTCERLLDQNIDHQRTISKIQKEPPWKTDIISFICCGLCCVEACGTKTERIHAHKESIQSNLAHAWRVVQTDICGSVITAPMVETTALSLIGQHRSYHKRKASYDGSSMAELGVVRGESNLYFAFGEFKGAVCDRLEQMQSIDRKLLSRTWMCLHRYSGYALGQLKSRPEALNPLKEQLRFELK